MRTSPAASPAGLGAKIEKNAVRVLPVFDLIAKTGAIPPREMFNTFNMGVGMTVITDKADADKAIELLNAAGEEAYLIGEIAEMGEGVMLW